MESNTAKRRKLEHADGGPTFEAVNATASTMGASGASAFVLETEELLKEVKFDYGKTSSDVEDILRQLKDVIEASEPHEPLPVSPTPYRDHLAKCHTYLTFMSISLL